MRDAGCGIGRRGSRALARALAGVFLLVSSVSLAAPLVELRLVPYDETDITVDVRTHRDAQSYLFYPYTLTEGQRDVYVGPTDMWPINFQLDGKPVFEIYYQGSYIDRLPRARPKNLARGDHTIWPGNHVFTVNEDGTVTSEDPEFIISTEETEEGEPLQVVRIKCYPVKIKASDADPRAAKPRELFDEIPLPSLAIRDAGNQEAYEAAVARMKADKAPGVSANLLELMPSPGRYLWITLWLPASTDGKGYLLHPLRHTFHVTPDGILAGAGDGHAVRGWRAEGFAINIPMGRIPVTGPEGGQVKVPGMQLIKFGRRHTSDMLNLYPRAEPYEFRVSEAGAGLVIDGDLTQLPNKVGRVDWRTAEQLRQRGMLVETESRHLDLGQTLRARVRALDPIEGSLAAAQLADAEAMLKRLTNSVKGATAAVTAAAAGVRKVEANVARARTPLTTAEAKRDKIQADIKKLTDDIAEAKRLGTVAGDAAKRFEAARVAADAAKTAVAAAEEGVKAAQTKVTVSDNQLKAATERMASAKARLPKEEQALEEATKRLADAKAKPDAAAVTKETSAVQAAEAALSRTRAAIREATGQTDAIAARAPAEQAALRKAEQARDAARTKSEQAQKELQTADKANVMAGAARDKANVQALTARLETARTSLAAAADEIAKAKTAVAAAVKKASTGLPRATAAVKKAEDDLARLESNIEKAKKNVAARTAAARKTADMNPLDTLTPYAKIRAHDAVAWADLAVTSEGGGYFTATIPQGIAEGVYSLRIGALSDKQVITSLYIDQWITLAAPKADVGVGLFTRRGRDAYYRGESFWLAMGVVATGKPVPAGTPVSIDVVDETGTRLSVLSDRTEAEITDRKTYVVRFPSSLTLNLAPGVYRAEPRVGDRPGPALSIEIVEPEPETHFTKLLLGKYCLYMNLYSGVIGQGDGVTDRMKQFSGFLDRSSCPPDQVVRGLKEAGFNAFKGMDYGMHRVSFPGSERIAKLVKDRPQLGPWEAFTPESGRDQFLNECVRNNIRFYENLFTQHDSILPRGEKFLDACVRFSTLEGVRMRHQPAFRGVCMFDEFSQSLDHDTPGVVLAHIHRADEINYRRKHARSSSSARRRLDRFTARPAGQRDYEDLVIFKTWPRHLDSQWREFCSRMSDGVKSVMPSAKNWTLYRIGAHPGDNVSAGPGNAFETMYADLDFASCVGYKDMGGWGDFPASGPVHADFLRYRDGLDVYPMIYGLGTGPYSDSNLRHAFFTLSQDPDGITFFQFEVSPAHPKDGDNFGGVRDITRSLLTPYGDLLLAAERGYKKVAIHYSRDAEFLSPRKPTAVGLEAVLLWTACLRAGFPADILSDGQLRDDRGMEYDVIFLPGWFFEEEVPPETLAAMKRLAAAGKVLVVEKGSRLPVDDVVRLDSAFDEMDDRLGGSFPQHLDFDDERWWDMSEKTTALLRSFLAEHVPPAAEHDMLVGPDWLRCRGGEYLVMPNHAFTGFRGNHKTTYQAPAIQVLRIPKRPPVCYDMLEMKRADVKTDGDWMELTADMRSVPGKIFAFLPKEIARTVVRVPESVRAGENLDFHVSVADAQGKRIDAGVPVEITLTDGAGKTLLHVYRAATPVYRGAYRVPANLAGGNLTLRARELISGIEVSAPLKAAAAPSGAAAIEKVSVRLSDRDALRTFMLEHTAIAKPLFTTNDLADARGLLLRIRDGGTVRSAFGEVPDELSKYLGTMFPETARKKLEAYNKRKAVPVELKQALVDALNSVVTGDVFYTLDRVPPGILTMEEGRLGETTTKTEGNLPEVNRMLLEGYYARELIRRHPVFIGVEEPWAIPAAERLRAHLEKMGRRVRVTRMEPWAHPPSPGWSLDDDVLTGLDGMRMWRGGVVRPGIVVDGPLVLLGARNGLVDRLIANDLVADPVSEHFPGAGNAVVGWVPKAFSPYLDTAYVLATDAEGLRKGVDALIGIEDMQDTAPARRPIAGVEPGDATPPKEVSSAQRSPDSYRDRHSTEDRVVAMDVDAATGRLLLGTAGYGDNLFCFSREGALLWKTFLPEHDVYYARWIDGGKRVAASTAHGFYVFLLDAANGKVLSRFDSTEWPNLHVNEREWRTEVRIVDNPPARQLLILGATGLLAVDYDGKKMWFLDRARDIVEYPKEAVQTAYAAFGSYLRSVTVVPSPDGSRLAYNEERYFASTMGFGGPVPLYRNEPQILDARTGRVLVKDVTLDPGANDDWLMTWEGTPPVPWIHADNLSAPLIVGAPGADGVRSASLGAFVEPARPMLSTGGWIESDFAAVFRYDARGMDRWAFVDRTDSWIKERDVMSADHSRLYRAGRSGWILCLDLNTGKEIWRSKLPFDAVLHPDAANHLVAAGRDGTVVRFDPTGTRLWEKRLRDLHELPGKDYPGYLRAAIERDAAVVFEPYPVFRDGPDDFEGVLRMGIEQLENGACDRTNHWVAAEGQAAVAAPGQKGSALAIEDGQLVTSRIERRVIRSATYLLEFSYRPETEDAILAAGAHLGAAKEEDDVFTLSNFQGTPGVWTFARVAVKTMADTESIDAGFQPEGGKVLVDNVSFRPVRFPSANLLAHAELHKIKPTHPKDMKVQYNRIPQSLREDLMTKNNVAAFMQSTPHGALVVIQDSAFLHNGRLDDLKTIWSYRPKAFGFAAVLVKEAWISHVVLYLNNAMPDTTYEAISVLVNDLEAKVPQTAGLVRGDQRRFLVVELPEPIYTDNVKVLPGKHRTWTDSITEIELYGPVGGPETLAKKGFPEDEKAVPMFMGTPSHVVSPLPADLVGTYSKAGGLQIGTWGVAPALHSTPVVARGAAAFATAEGLFRAMPLTREEKDAKTIQPETKIWNAVENRWDKHVVWRAGRATPLTTPAWYAKRIISGSADHSVHAVADNGSHVWAFRTGGRVYSSPVPDGNEVYFGSDDGKLYKIDVDSGMLIWEFATSNRVRSAPALAGGVVYAASWDGHLYAVDTRLGRLKWKAKIAERTSASPAVHKGKVYIGDEDGGLHCFNAGNGALAWSRKLPGRISNGPVVTPDGVFYLSEEGQGALVGLDGTVRWQKDVLAPLRPGGIPPMVTGQPFATQTQLVISSTRGLLVLKRADGAPDPRFVPAAKEINVTGATLYGDRLCVVQNTTKFQGDLSSFIVNHGGMANVWEAK